MKNILERMLEAVVEGLSEGKLGLLERALDGGVDKLL